MVNEDGLPIIEITEPVEDVDSLGAGITSVAQEDKLIPLASLPMTQRERLRQERERILDMLEEEERLEEQRERERLLEEKKDLIRKKVEEAAKQKDRSTTAREMQKKMGRALLGKNSTDEGKNDAEIMAGKADSAKPKKSVSFVAEPIESTEEAGSPERETWGDISLARLRPMNRPTLLTKVDETRQPMKTKVVERKIVGHVPTMQRRHLDSDDESDLDDKEDEASVDDGQESPHAEQPLEDSASESDATNESLEDLDFARHQREIALEYYAKRGIIGQAAAQALMSHSHAGEDQKVCTHPWRKRPYSLCPCREMLWISMSLTLTPQSPHYLILKLPNSHPRTMHQYLLSSHHSRGLSSQHLVRKRFSRRSGWES